MTAPYMTPTEWLHDHATLIADGDTEPAPQAGALARWLIRQDAPALHSLAWDIIAAIQMRQQDIPDLIDTVREAIIDIGEWFEQDGDGSLWHMDVPPPGWVIDGEDEEAD